MYANSDVGQSEDFEAAHAAVSAPYADCIFSTCAMCHTSVIIAVFGAICSATFSYSAYLCISVSPVPA